MQPVRKKGQLIKWKDDRGFGFIKPDDGSPEIFIHISALKGAGRRPQVGDTIFYEQGTDSNGKPRAVRASIQGVTPQPQPSVTRSRSGAPRQNRPSNHRKTNNQTRNQGLIKIGVGIPLLIVMALFNFGSSSSRSPSLIAAIIRPECNIKGNISVNSGKRYYHIPGMEDYKKTIIDTSKGERWFCSESEATDAGWEKAQR